jgi:hypothetical protein
MDTQYYGLLGPRERQCVDQFAKEIRIEGRDYAEKMARTHRAGVRDLLKSLPNVMIDEETAFSADDPHEQAVWYFTVFLYLSSAARRINTALKMG